MGFWIFMLIMDMLIPAVMIGFGRLFLKKPPKDINAAFGYRTNMSMKNKDTWVFAHKYCGKMWYICGIILLPLSIIAMLFVIRESIDTIALSGVIICSFQACFLIGSIFPTEKALKKTFDKNGRRRQIPPNRTFCP